MKRRISLILVAALMICCLAGCAKLISKEHEVVDVVITETYHRGGYTTFMFNGKTSTPMYHPAVYRVSVKYNGVVYTINGRDTYNRYKDREGETVKGTLEIRSYDDGSIHYDIIELE